MAEVEEQAVTLALVMQRMEQQDDILKEIKNSINELNRHIRDSVDRRLVELDKAQALAQQSVKAYEMENDELKTILERQDKVLNGTMTMVNDMNRHIRESVDKRISDMDKEQAVSQKSIDELTTTLSCTEVRVKELEKSITKLLEVINVYKWVGGIVGSAVVIWVVSQLLGLIG